MSELRTYAKNKGISLKGKRKKVDIIDAIKQAEALRKSETKTAVKKKPASSRKNRRKTAVKTASESAAKPSVKEKRPKRTPKQRVPSVSPAAGSSASSLKKDAHTLSLYGSEGSKFDTMAQESDGKIAEERSKFYIAPEENYIPRPLSHDYAVEEEKTTMRAVLRDPETLYVYWNISEQEYHRAERKLLNHDGKHLVLRIVTVETGSFYEFDLSGQEHDRYIDVQEKGVTLQASVLLKNREGQSVLLVSSNGVDVPHTHPDLSGASREEQLLFALSLGVSPEEFDAMVKDSRIIFSRVGSEEFLSAEEEMMRRMLANQLSSHLLSSVSSAGSVKNEEEGRTRGFRFEVGAELIVYGSTEPDAKVTFQGREISLDADGSFRFHFPFPDGNISCPVSAVSADGFEKRSLSLNFNRTTSKEQRTFNIRG